VGLVAGGLAATISAYGLCAGRVHVLDALDLGGLAVASSKSKPRSPSPSIQLPCAICLLVAQLGEEPRRTCSRQVSVGFDSGLSKSIR
jgi:hypothetical protein